MASATKVVELDLQCWTFPDIAPSAAGRFRTFIWIGLFPHRQSAVKLICASFERELCRLTGEHFGARAWLAIRASMEDSLSAF